jgi:hypothetical protein
MSFLDKLESLRADPTRLQSAIYDAIEDVSAGRLTMVDPTNPVSLCLEAMAFTAAHLEERDRIAQRASYPSLAQTWDDLYRHMSDQDFIGRFGSPSTIPVRFMFSIGELKTHAVALGDTGISKLVLPKHTKVRVASTDWLLQYPVEIRFMPHGGIRVLYDTSVTTPLLTLESNLVEWVSYFAEDQKMIELMLPMQQITLTRYLDTLSANAGFRKSYTLTDQYYHCRVYGRRANGALTELRTTHSNQVYDPKVPTAVLDVQGNKFYVSIPLIYFTNGLLPGGVQIDIFTTKGDIVLNAGDYVANAFELEWGSDHNTPEDATFAAALTKVSQMSVFSTGIATGGSNGLTLDQLRERTINNANQTNFPISDKQLESALEIKGYQIVRSIDNVVRRTFLASRSLSPGISGFSVGAGCGIVSAEFPVNQFNGQSLFRDNGLRVTLMDGLVFNLTTGVPSYLSDSEVATLLSMPKDRFLTALATNQYVYTPLSYVLDFTNNSFAVRAYDFNNPEINARQFVLENDTTGVSVSTVSYRIERTPTGYDIFVLTSSDEGYKGLGTDKLFAQMYFKPVSEISRAYLNGELVGLIDGEYVWKFSINTQFDVDSNQSIWLTNLAMFVAEPRKFGAALAQQFGLIYGLVDVGPIDYAASEIDGMIGTHLLDPSAIGITHELLTISFGYHMKDLWSNGRTVAGNLEYLRYTADVPLVWSETQYLRDSSGDIIIVPTNDPPYTVIAHKGEQIVIDGEPQFKARRGDLVYDEDSGLPVPINTRKTLRIVDLLVVDGVYQFATGEADIAYRESIPRELVAYLKQDLSTLTPRLLEKTDMYLYPKKTIGRVDAYVQDGQLISLPASLPFTVKYWLNDVNYANESLRESIRIQTHEIINTLLQSRQVGTDDIIVAIRNRIGNDIIAVDVDKFGPNKDIPNYTMFDDTARCAVKRKLKSLPDGSLRVVEDITIEFVLHRTA